MVLKKKADLARPGSDTQLRYIHIVHAYGSLGQRKRPTDAAQQRTFPTAVRPKDRQYLAAEYIQMQRAEHRLLAIAKGGPTNFDERFDYSHEPRVLRSR